MHLYTYKPYTLVWPTVTRQIQDPLAMLLLNNQLYMLTLQSFKSRIVYLLMFKVKQDSLGDNIW